ncbi:MAG: EAL domain-containing protein [Alphaproteobacteria bacterium]|nr:EAL domain-containing protein [Alphaproteobacteria bacterium]
MSDDSNMQDIVLAALDASGDVAYFWDNASDRMTFYGKTDALFGADVVVPDGESFHARVNAEDLRRRLALLSEVSLASRVFDCEYRVRRSDGKLCWVQDRGRIFPAESGKPARTTGTLRIVTDRKVAEAEERDSAIYDALTGHYNRSRLREALDHALSHAQRYAQRGGYMVIGIDGLSQITDVHGSDNADQVIVTVGRRLEDSVRTTDVIGRTDDGCFGIVLSRCAEDGLAAAADKIIAKIAAEPIVISSGSIPVTVSVGGVVFPDVAKTPTGAMSDSDNAYREASKQGTGQFSLHQLSAHQVSHRGAHTILGAALLDALRDDRIALAYQPVVRANDGATAYHETLLRVVGEESGPFEASVFVPVAEQLGHSRHIDRRVLELAVADLVEHPDASLAINISAFTTTDRSWLRLFGSLVKGRPEIARRLMVEITETAEIYDFEDAARFVSAVRDLGCRVALDDFGVGYTSFRHLKSLPVDVVKIDGSFIRGIATKRESQEFLDTLLGLTHSFGVETVAECVEAEADRDYLLDRGVTYLQGWIYGRPELDGLEESVRSSSSAA